MPTSKKIKQAMDSRLSSLVMTPEMRAAVHRGVMETRRKKPIRLRKGLVSALAACLVFVFGVSVAASTFPPFETFISRMGEEWRQLVQPVNQEVERSGIRMAVAAAVHDGDTAIVYLTLQDTESARIDATTEIFASNLESYFSFAQLVHYDADTATTTFRLEGLANEENFKSGQKITVEIGSILSGMTTYERRDTGFTVADIRAANPAPEYSIPALTSWGLAYGDDEDANEELHAMLENEEMPALTLREEPISHDADDILTLTNIGVIGDFVHIQQMPQGIEHHSMFSFYLDSAEPGNLPAAQLASANIELGEAEDDGDYREYPYTEHILQLPDNASEEDLHLFLNGWGYDYFIEDSWKVTFVLDEDPMTLETDCSINMNGWTISHLTISSIGVTADGEGQMGEDSDIFDVVITMNDGSTVEYSSISSWSSAFDNDSAENQFEVKNSFSKPIDLAQIQSVCVNGQYLDFEAAAAA